MWYILCMSRKNIDSSPISLLEEIFNVKQLPKNYKNNDNKIIYRHSLPISGNVTTVDIRSYLENILSEFNHLVSMLLKGGNVAETTQILINQKIVGHA